jgi:hypothetical protein
MVCPSENGRLRKKTDVDRLGGSQSNCLEYIEKEMIMISKYSCYYYEMKLPIHVIIQLFDAPLYCIQASIYHVQEFEHNTEIAASNFLEIKTCHYISKEKPQEIKPAHQHASNIYPEGTSISW